MSTELVEKRKAVARDILDRLEDKKFVPVFSQVLAFSPLSFSGRESPVCQACAVGSAILSMLDVNHIDSHETIRATLAPLWSSKQIASLEYVYQGDILQYPPSFQRTSGREYYLTPSEKLELEELFPAPSREPADRMRLVWTAILNSENGALLPDEAG